MVDRVRARMRFTAASGLAVWCRDNMAVRHSQAVHLNEGEPSEEAPVNEVVDDGAEQVFRCDLPLMDTAHAADAFATLSAATVLGQSLVLGSEEGVASPSWVEHHECHHDETPPAPCETVSRAEGPV